MNTWPAIGIGVSIGVIICAILEARYRRWGK